MLFYLTRMEDATATPTLGSSCRLILLKGALNITWTRGIGARIAGAAASRRTLPNAAGRARRQVATVKGESFMSIGRKVRLAFAAILALSIGLTGVATPLAEAHAQTHVVSHGESLWTIANRYGISVEQVRQANGIYGTIIYPGQRLYIPETVNATAAGVAVTNDDLDWLAKLVWSEAEAEPYAGKVAAAAVVLNRVKSPLFPNTVRGVIFEPGQFEPVMNGHIYRPAPAVAYQAARDALSGWDPSYGAIYFFNPSKVTNAFLWARPLTVVIGNHRFTR